MVAGKPDAIVQLPEPQKVKAEGTMPYQHVSIKTDFPEDRWVQGRRDHSRDPRGRASCGRVHDARSQAGREGAELRSIHGFFAAYVPGNGAVMFPEGFAKKLPKGATLTFEMHYTPNGTATTDQTRLGIFFADKAPTHTIRVAGIHSRGLKIPPHASDHTVSGRVPVPEDVKLLAFMPHMHLRGKSFRYEAVLPDDSRQTLLEVPRYDFNWQLRYEYRDPLALPKGSFIRATGTFDNSEDNPNNPDPSANGALGAADHR